MVQAMTFGPEGLIALAVVCYVALGGMIAAYCSIPDESGENLAWRDALQILCFWPYVVYLARKEDMENE
jgi:hypothetical protein